MRTKRVVPGFWVACLCALMPPFAVRCPTPDRGPQDAQPGRLETSAERPSIGGLRRLVLEHADLEGVEGRTRLAPAEAEYHAAAGVALERLQGAARVAAGPCASGLAATVEVDSFDRVATSLQNEFERHRAQTVANEGPNDEEERRHREGALDLLDELERAYDDVEYGARQRAGVGCLWYADG